MARPLAKPLLAILIVFLQLQLSLQQQCSESQLCEIGCCSRSGFCGFGPDFCGTGCLSGCDRKSDCNPGWDSKEWSSSESCPLNVCCSKFGFCGTTEEFCGDDDKVNRPSCSVGDTKIDRVIGYYEAWSTTERSCYSMLPEDIPYGYYTHINFAFATINPQTFEIHPGDALTASYMERIKTIKLLQPDVQIWIAVGGWTFNDPGPTATTFSDIASSAENTNAFIDSLIKLMNKYDLDGLDLDWEYPVAKDRSGRDEDFNNFVTMMRMIKETLKKKGLKKGISLTLPSSYWYLQHFDIKRLQDHVDWFNIMSYDIHGSWDIDNDWTGPYANAHTNMTEIQYALDLLWRNDVDPDKVVMGMSYYTRSFTLENPSCNTPGCVVSSAGNPGRCSDTTGVLLHGEIQEMVREHGVTPVLHRDAAVKTVSWGNQWVSFDDAVTWRLKVNAARGQCISGVMVWAISQDDKSATNAKALISATGRTIMTVPDWTTEPMGQEEGVDFTEMCRWVGCGTECPSGWKEIKREGTDQIMADHTHCSLPGTLDRFCCPANQPLPKCRWRGHKNSGDCRPGCEDGEVTVGSLRVGCNLRHQSACCTEVSSTYAYGQCKWVGSAPTCKAGGGQADCPDDYPNRLFSTTRGSGGEQPCVSGSKSFCCKIPSPPEFTNCKWSRRGSKPISNMPYVCEEACPDGHLKLATRETVDCVVGAEAYCCNPPKRSKIEPRDEDWFNYNQAKEFKEILKEYMEDPTCPATDLDIPPLDAFGGSAPSKRDLTSPVMRRPRALMRRRDEGCSRDTFVTLVSFVTGMIKLGSPLMDLFGSYWDKEFADHYDTNLRYHSLLDYFDDFPEMDVRSRVETILLNPLSAGLDRREEDGVRETFCQPSDPLKKRHADAAGLFSEEKSGPYGTEGVKDDEDVARRWISPTSGRPNQPSLLDIITAINEGRMTVYYARWQYVSGSDTDRAPGPMLEIAYRIPAGEAGNNLRDRSRPATSAQDEWVVFHFHIDPTRNWLRRIGSNTYMGVTSIRVYHGQTINTLGNGHWRVQNDDRGRNPMGLNARSGIVCPTNNLWYIGAPNAGGHVEDSDLRVALLRWTRALFTRGYAASIGIRVMLTNSGRLPDGQIDPSQPYTVPIRTTEIVYLVNWRVNNNGRLEQVPNPP